MIPPQQGAQPQTVEQMGAVPQSQAQQGQVGKLSPQDLDYLRNGDPEVKKAIELFVGHPVDMSKIPNEIISEVAGMVAKLGPEGAVAMARKMIPAEMQNKMRMVAK